MSESNEGREFRNSKVFNLCQKTTIANFRCKSLKSWKIDNIDLTQKLISLSIFTDFRYPSIKITWLLPVFIDWLLRALRCDSKIKGLIHMYYKKQQSWNILLAEMIPV